MTKLETKKKSKESSLLNTAFEFFTTKGFSKTSITDIASKAGVGKGTFYLYFKDKYDIRNRLIARKSEQVFQKTHPAPADGSIEIYVGNLSYDMTDELLNKEFSAYGKVNSARIITNRYNGKSKGFGFVHMPNQAEADAAVKALNDKEVLGRRIKCNEAKNVIK